MSHTPTPWMWWNKATGRPKGYDLAHLLGDGGAEFIFSTYGGAGNKALGSSLRQIANAEFIVRACNAHDELVKACKTAVLHLECTDASRPEIVRNVLAQCRAALAKATK